MSQWSQVAAASDRTVARHDRCDLRVQQRDQRVGHDRPHAGESHGQRAGAQEHRRAHDLVVDRRPHPGGVGADQRELQLGLQERSDPRAGQRAEAGGDAIHRLPGSGGSLDPGPAALHPGARRGRQGDLLSMTGHIHDLALGQPGAPQRDGH